MTPLLVALVLADIVAPPDPCLDKPRGAPCKPLFDEEAHGGRCEVITLALGPPYAWCVGLSADGGLRLGINEEVVTPQLAAYIAGRDAAVAAEEARRASAPQDVPGSPWLPWASTAVVLVVVAIAVFVQRRRR